MTVASNAARAPETFNGRILMIGCGSIGQAVLPIIGRHPTLEGLIIATAMQGDGICWGPLVGGAVARLACDLEPTQDLSALSPLRFAMGPVAGS